MSVISFRLPDDEEQRLRARGINPASLAKELVQERLRKQDVEATLDRLARRSKPPSRSIIETVREARETRP